MNFIWFQLLFALCTQKEAHSTRDTTITVTTKKNLFCFNESCELSSLDDLIFPAHDLALDATIDITFHTNSTELSTVKEFSDVLSVSLKGGSHDGQDKSEITCRGDIAGIKLTRVRTVHLERIIMKRCGFSFHGDMSKAGMIIHSATQVTVSDCTVTNPTEMGIALINVVNSNISNCTFEQLERRTEDWQGARSGLYIEVNGSNTSHTISGCYFTGNAEVKTTSWEGENQGSSLADTCWSRSAGENVDKILDVADPNMYSRGAGVRVHLQGLSSDNSISVVGCSFERIAALWGGGIYISIQGSANANMLIIHASKFRKTCAFIGGGAVAVSFLSQGLGATPVNNKVEISECTFTGNTALVGGALQFSYSLNPLCSGLKSRNKIKLHSCTFEKNTAHHGAAIDGRPIKSITGMLAPPLVSLKDCKFKMNTVELIMRDGDVAIRGAGTVKFKKADIKIDGKLELHECTGSALYLESSNVNFANNSSSTFTGNRGYQGAAIAMVGGQEATISVQGSSHIWFRYNQAETNGGAVFQESSEYCFINGKEVDEPSAFGEMKPVLEFENNTALSDIGHSVFVNSLIACIKATQCDNYQEAIDSIAHFEFPRDKDHQLATPGRAILSNVTFPPSVIPGKSVPLSIYMLDDTNATVTPTAAAFKVVTNSPDIDVVVDNNMMVTILGKPRSQVRIAISPSHKQELQLTISTYLSACPPGFYYDAEHKSCICSSKSKGLRYIGIQTCDDHEFQASLLHSHWAGYMKREDYTNNSEELVFRTAYCPKGFCATSNKTYKDILLPSQVTNYDLSHNVCRENRIGVLCSTCSANHSAYFPRFNCRKNEHCNLGGLYYILSQIIPVTIIFSLLLAFDLSLTSGLVGGVIFYMQMMDALLLTANDFLWFEPPVYKILLTLRVLSRMTNLQFFAHRKFSFCLWEGATTLDILAFNYITVTYSFLMVIFTVTVVNPLVLRIKKCYRRQAGLEYAGSRSIIHGLTGFLVLCYSQSTHTSLYLLAGQIPHGRGSKEDTIRKRVFFNGELRFFEKEHLPYAIPATFMLLTITLLPLLLLLSYPLCYRVLALCRLQESKFSRVLCRVVPLEKYKPLFDSFQGSFKDDHRYFAGFYFMYRLIWLVALASIRELASFYVTLEVKLVLILLLTAYMQPHKNKWHNRIDACIFALLAIINACTIYSYHKRNDYTHPSNYIQIANTIQVALACLPPLSVAGYLMWVGAVWVGAKFTRRKQQNGGTDEDEGEIELIEPRLPRSLVNLLPRTHEEEKSSIGYKLLADKK